MIADFADVEEVPNLWNGPGPMVARLGVVQQDGLVQVAAVFRV